MLKMRINYQNQKPEAALQRAHDFISVGKQKDALQALHDLIKDRRHKQWSQTYEQIMLKYVELCVNLRNSALAKDGLYQYKLITQQVAVKSLETVLERFILLAEQKTLEAQKHSIEKIEEIDDLDVADAPENLLLSFVSGAVPQDRMDRTVLSPWLRFLWDTYRNCLDLLRNNIYVEQLYQQIARKSFAFCLKYQRRNEFRKLCEMLRLHLAQVQKAQLAQSTPGHAIKLTNMDSLSLMLETRLIQLDTAIQMELWQEAYKSAEDLHNLMQIGKDKDKKIVKPSSYVNYYDKIALVFWKGGNALFHAASLLQKFNIYKDLKKQFTDEEAMDQATRVLLATLSIPDGAENPSILTKHLDIEEQHAANTRVLSALLKLQVTPTRAGILKEIARLNIPELASPLAHELYKHIEMDFNPLRIAPSVQALLAQLGEMDRPAYSQYTDSIKQTVAAKMVKHVSTVYDSLTLDHFAKIIPFYDRINLEQFLVDICKNQSIKARIDHRDQCIHFESASLAGDMEREDDNEVEKVKKHLALLYSRLNQVFTMIDPSWTIEMENKLKRQIMIYTNHREGDFERILLRRKKIEHYKENTEQMKKEKILEAQALASQQEEKRRTEEYKKLQLENKENEKRRRLADQEDIKRKMRMEQLKKYKNQPYYEQWVKDYGEEALADMDLDQLIIKKRELLATERKEQQAKMLQQEKKYDYTVRAFHLEEMGVLKQMSEEFQRTAPGLHEQYEAKRIQREILEHEKSFETYERLTRVRDDAIQFIRGVISSHEEEFKAQMAQWEHKVHEAREAAIRHIAMQRMEADRQEAEQKRQQEEQRRLEEEKQEKLQQQRAAEQKKLEAEQKRQEARRAEEAAAKRESEEPQKWRRSAAEPRPQVLTRATEPRAQPVPAPATATASQSSEGEKKKGGKYVPPSLRNRQ